MSNFGYAAGVDPNTGVIYRTREAAERDAGRSIGINAAGMPIGTVIAERRAPLAGDPGACLKLIKIAHRDAPHGLEKSDPVVIETKPVEPTHKLSENEHITDPVSVTDLIRKAQSNPGAIEDLERGYSGREIAAIAKAAAAKPREVGNSDFDKVSLPLRKAIAEFDSIVRRAVERGLRPLAKFA